LIFERLMKPKAGRKRLDLLLIERGCADSPQKALAMILAGEVQVDGQPAEKAGMPVAEDARIEVTSRLQKFASRGGTKLEGALKDFAIEPAGWICLDIGASNGGFTDCLLQRGAARVYALDVNVEQLDWKLTKDARVTPIKW
jgi:23S rRNA (cytidine1920-2'-O)/16S rRNA (cytidine1409-2'-O)-methyltransferase